MRVPDATFARQIRDALSDLYDPAALRGHPLWMTLAPDQEDAQGSNGTALRDRLLQAIEALRPAPRVDPASKAWLVYRILQLRYVEARAPTDVQHELAMSKSQYYREHEAALASVTALLREQLVSSDSGPAHGAVLQAAEPTRVEGEGSSAPRERRASLASWLVAGSGLMLVVGLAIVYLIRSASAPGDAADVGAIPGAASDHAQSPPPLSAILSTYAGDGEPGHINGAAALARFAGPFGLGLDNGGTVYVADTGNHVIRSITTSGLVLDLAGSGVEGFADGPSATAQFSSPNAVTVGPDGTVYVADSGNLRIRAIAPSRVVSTLAGSGIAGYVDGVGAEAQFALVGAVVADPAGNLYVSDRLNSVIRKITPAGVVSTFAGSGTRGHADGPSDQAQFNVPQRMGADPNGNIYILDTGDNHIRRIAPDGQVSTMAGSDEPGFLDGPTAEARFSADILGITADKAGNLYVMDAGNRRVRQVTADGSVSTLFEVTDPGHAPGNIKLDQAGNLYLSDREHNRIYKLTLGRSR
jgi:sugar lactone lactonase YvrE